MFDWRDALDPDSREALQPSRMPKWTQPMLATLIDFCHLDTIFEFNPGIDLDQVIEPVQASPLFLGTLAEFEHHMQHAVTGQTPLRAFRPVADRCKGRFNWVGGPNALPVLGREFVEGEQFSPVFLQAQDRLRALRFIRFDEQIEGLLSSHFGLCLPDFVQRLFDFGLTGLRRVIQYIRRLVHPAALLACLRIDPVSYTHLRAHET